MPRRESRSTTTTPRPLPSPPEGASRDRWWRTPTASARLVPRSRTGAAAALRVVAKAACVCTACELNREGTRTVFGEGPSGAALMLVGEQPGDKEDQQGKPFVGPAGTVLDKALADAGIDRSAVYMTNAVKHFNFVLTTGNRRLHEKPKNRHVLACRGWLEAEIEKVAPRLIVCLGATAALALLGREFRLTQSRGRAVEGPAGTRVLATFHPSAILRAPDAARRDELWSMFVGDLKHALTLVTGAVAARAPRRG